MLSTLKSFGEIAQDCMTFSKREHSNIGRWIHLLNDRNFHGWTNLTVRLLEVITLAYSYDYDFVRDVVQAAESKDGARRLACHVDIKQQFASWLSHFVI